ncbi:hypothetical protein B0A58_07345 [Flavobacterium branchiophilum NBRC 15030 = ATCC 35035]|nr:hypothetical protein B0A58_07345 [Flavobacterium branchiophilum NBRC 15030 = ATCC 35035]
MNDLMREFDAKLSHKEFSFDAFRDKLIKIHTIREDKNDRWKVGNKIDFFINARQKNMFRFAPVLPVVNTQKIEIYHSGGAINTKTIYVDDECYVANYDEKYNSSKQRQQLNGKLEMIEIKE